MKKLITLIAFCLLAVFVNAQPNGQQQENNLTIRNDQPMLHLRGEGAVINFYNGDLRLTRSSNVLTLTGGIFKISSDTVATQAYARLYGGGGGTWGSITGTLANQLDLQAALDLKAPLASPTLTGVPLAPTAAVGTSTTQVATTEYVQNEITAGIDLSDVVPYLVDTVPLVTFGAGAGLTADTALFNNNVLIGSFFNDGSDTLVITQMTSVMYSGTGTETISVQISWDANFIDGTPTNLGASAFVIAGAEALEGGAGEVDTSFSNDKIPPGNWVWGRLSGASANNKPTFLSVTLSGYKIPTY